MSIHKSLSPKNRLRRQRNVLSRLERIQKLEEEGRWSEDGDSVFGLPKVRVARVRRTKKKAKEKEEEALAAEEGAEALEGAAEVEEAAEETPEEA
ncbi:MAG: small basic protein [Planctomycetota bacterium]